MTDLDDTVILPQQREATSTKDEIDEEIEALAREPGEAAAAAPDRDSAAPAADVDELDGEPHGRAGDKPPDVGNVVSKVDDERPDSAGAEAGTDGESAEATQVLSTADIDESLRARALVGEAAPVGETAAPVGEAAPEPVVASAPVLGQHRARDRALGQLAWIGSALVTAAISLLRMDWPALWQDELATWGMATVAWEDMPALLRDFDVVLGPYYALMRAWAELFGTSDLALRLPSVLATIGSAAMIAAIGTRLASPRVGFLAGLLFAILPTTSRYAQEARPYALTTFAAVLATLLLVRAFDRPRFWRFTGYALALMLVGALHPIALALLAGHGFAVLLIRARLFARWLVAAIFGVLPALPLFWLGNGQKDQISWIPRADLDSLVAYPEKLFGVALLAGIVLALALFAISLRHPAVVYTTWALIPTAVIFVAAIYTPLWTPRYLLFTIPAWALLAATALGRAPLMRGTVALLAVATIGIPVQVAMREPDGHTQDTRKLTGLIEAMAQPGDGIVYGSLPGEGRLGRDAIAHYVPAGKRPKDLLAVRPPRTDGHVFAKECAEVAPCLGSTQRIWLVRLGRVGDPIARAGNGKERPLRGYEVAKTWHPRGLTLALLLRRPG